MLQIMHDYVLGGGQFVIANHSPVLLAYPDATIVQLSELGSTRARYADVHSVELWRDLLDSPGRFLGHLPCRRRARWFRRDVTAMESQRECPASRRFDAPARGRAACR